MEYPYEPLGGDRKGFRLLKVYPAQDNDPLECSMLTRGLEDRSCSYETISYCWGDHARDSELHIDEHIVAVPVSAAAALRRMRKTDQDRLLFIDIVCINQADLGERGQQVLSMGHIYANATCNLVYLGEEDETTASAVRTIERIYEEMAEETDGFRTLWSTVADPDKRNARRSSTGLRNLDGLDFQALERFYGRPWFSRLWVTLETLVACSNQCYCGQYSFPLKSLLRVPAWLCYKSFHLPVWIPNTLSHAIWAWWLTLDRENESVPAPFSGFQTFLELLVFVSSRNTSEEMDRIYALHSLYNGQLPQSLLPDYERSLLDLMCDATRQTFVDEEGRVAMTALHHVYHASDGGLMNGAWPSWVPDWKQYRSDPGTLEPFFEVTSSPPSPQTATLIDTSPRHELHLRGKSVGSIAATTRPLSKDAFDHAPSLLRWLEHVAEQSKENISQDQDDNDGGCRIVTEILTAVLTCTRLKPTSTSGPGLEPLPPITHLTHHLRTTGEIPRPSDLDPSAPKSATNTVAWNLYDKLWLYVIERSVFFAQYTDTPFPLQARTHVGLGPQLARKGDVVVVVEGSPWPLVLRRLLGDETLGSEGMDGEGEVGSEEREETPGRFRFVGECFVPDLEPDMRSWGGSEKFIVL